MRMTKRNMSISFYIFICQFVTIHGLVQYTISTKRMIRPDGFYHPNHNVRQNTPTKLFSDWRMENDMVDCSSSTTTTTEPSPYIQSRRKMILYTTGLSSIFSMRRPAWALPAATDPTTTIPFQDLDCGFEIKIPSTWEKSVQTLSDRRKIILFIEPNYTAAAAAAEEDDKTLLFIAYTPVRDDFTSLNSFGSVDQVS